MTLQDAVERLRKRLPVPLFVSEVWDHDLDAALRSTRVDELFEDVTIRDAHMAACAVAGLHLWNDNFDASHDLCQGVDSRTGSYWHGLCHRREGRRGSGLRSNLGNARYWFRQAGGHPAFPEVFDSALRVLDSTGGGFRWATEAAGQLRERRRWDPCAMIDWFGQADAGVLSGPTVSLLEEIQWREIDILAGWCVKQAIG